MNPPPMDSHDDDSSKDGSLDGDLRNSSANGDAEGVWSPDIEQSFQEALALYPPCGRRKIILSDEGKMYGRNELIARYIKIRTGKNRTRKQVSSHIQVLARRKQREVSSKIKGKGHDGHLPSHHVTQAPPSHVATAAAGLAALGLANPLSVSSYTSPQFWPPPGSTQTDDIKPFNDIRNFNSSSNSTSPTSNHVISNNTITNGSMHEERSIASRDLRLCHFTAFLEAESGAALTKHIFVQIGGANSNYSHPPLEDIDISQIYDKFPQNKEGLKELYSRGPQDAFFLVKFWADLNIPDQLTYEPGAFYGVTALFESTKNMIISCSTKVCSFGKQVVEKVEVEHPESINGRNFFRIVRSPMCEYMINFIHKLKDLPEKYMMNSVLENFTILQVVSNRHTQETLLCIAFVFEVSVSDHGAQHHIYRLVKPVNNNNNH